MLRILFINRMASMERGGGETFDLEIARHLAQMGHQITFLSGISLFGRARLPIGSRKSEVRGQRSEVRSRKSEVRGQRSEVRSQKSDLGPPTSELRYLTSVTLRAPMFPWFPWDRVKAGWRLRVAEFWLFEKLAARWAWKHRDQFDIIQVCELPTFVSSFKSRISNPESRIPKLVLRLTAPNAYDPSGGIQKADALIASGTSIAKIRASVRPDCHDIPNAVDTTRFCPQESAFRIRHGMAPEDMVLLYVARFQDFKNHALLIKAFALMARQVSKARLVLVGSGPLLDSIRTQVKEAGLTDRVLFLGEVPFDDLPAVFAAADVKVISSQYESFCFAAVEAMASGLPVVTTDCGWVPGLIGDTMAPIEKQWVYADPDPAGRFADDVEGKRIREVPGGLVTSRADPLSLAKAGLRLLESSDMRRRMGAWNRDKAVRDHGWEASAGKLEAVYEERDEG